MASKRKWNISLLKSAVRSSYSTREVIKNLGLVPAGGNYVQVTKAISENKIDISHFTGQGWRKNRTFDYAPRVALESILNNKTPFQSFKLKRRLIADGTKKPECELCGWAECSPDGRIPVELDHINGDKNDNRLENLRILCPNCHSLQPTHRGMNQRRRGGVIGSHARLKIS